MPYSSAVKTQILYNKRLQPIVTRTMADVVTPTVLSTISILKVSGHRRLFWPTLVYKLLLGPGVGVVTGTVVTQNVP
jgi:hypothetical protein